MGTAETQGDPDAETAWRAIRSAGPLISAIRTAGEERVREAVLDFLASYRINGGYRQENKVRHVTATV